MATSAAFAFGIAAAVAALAALGLAVLDPKRVHRHRGSEVVRACRWALGFILAAPAAWLIGLGHTDAFVAWFGTVGAFGLLAVQLVNRPATDDTVARR